MGLRVAAFARRTVQLPGDFAYFGERGAKLTTGMLSEGARRIERTTGVLAERTTGVLGEGGQRVKDRVSKYVPQAADVAHNFGYFLSELTEHPANAANAPNMMFQKGRHLVQRMNMQLSGGSPLERALVAARAGQRQVSGSHARVRTKWKPSS